ncbi:MAG: hypothetical protein AB1Z19_08075 [Eubacteriales bacterium]
MKIIIVTTEKDGLKESGFGGVPACLAIKEALRNRFGHIRISICGRENDMDVVAQNHPDLVILAAKYIPSRKSQKVWFSDYFEENGINFTGSKRYALRLGSNKIRAKKAVKKQGIETAPYMVVDKNNFPSEGDIKMAYPIFVKPLDAANGNGIDENSLVQNYGEFKRKSDQLFQKYGARIIAEKYLSGREFTVSVIEDEVNQKYCVSPIEIIAPMNKCGIRILGEKVKQCNVEELKRVDDEVLRQKLIKIALHCFKALDARDFARIDIKQDENNRCNFIEANLVPGMTEGSSYFPKAFEIDKGINYSEITRLMLRNAMSRVKMQSVSAD